MFPYTEILRRGCDVFGILVNGDEEHVAWCQHRTAAILVSESLRRYHHLPLREEDVDARV